MKKHVAFIGSRDLSQFNPEILDLYREAVRYVVGQGDIVVTGACKGADQLAADTALEAGGRVRLILPWRSYETGWVSRQLQAYPDQIKLRVYNDAADEDWTASVVDYHPNPDSLSNGDWALMARNYGIVAFSKVVIAIPTPPEGGGTAQGLRVARALGIPCFNLAVPEGYQALAKKLLTDPR